MHCAYLTGVGEWRPIVISLLFLVLGNVTGPVIVPLLRKLWRVLRARVDVGAKPARQRGVILDASALARLRPGESTVEDVLRVCGSDCEEHRQQHLSDEPQRILRYRGQRLVPHRSWRVGKVSHVRHWDIETHEVDVEIQNERVE